MALRRPVGPLRLDRKNQLTAGIIDVFAPLHAVNPVSGLRLGLVGTAASAQPSAAGLAQFTSGSSSSGLAVSAAPANVRVDEVTLLIITTPTNVSAATSFMYGFGSTGSSNPILAIGQSDSASQLYFFVRSDSGTLQNPSVTPPSGTWANNQPAVLVGTRSQARNLHEFYVNGHRAASTTATTIGATTLNTTAVGLLRRTSDGLFYTGYTTLCVAWNRYLSAAEIKRLSDDPWALFTWEFLPVKAASSGAYTLTCASGTYTLSGQAVTLKVTRTMSAAQGSYTLNGQAVALKVGRTMAVGQGSYALTGQAVGLSVARQMAANQGTYTLNGQAVTLSKSGGDKTLTAEQGTYTLSGQPVTLSATRRMTVDQGSYSLTGQAVTLSLGGRVLQAATGIYLLSGQEVMLTYSGQPPMAYDIVTARRRFRR